jgi:hypothetical protein
VSAARPVSALDPGELVLVAAEVLDADPHDVVATVDVGLLGAVVARVRAMTDLADAAAELLVAIAAGRPFGRADAEVAWLAAVVLVERNHHSIDDDGDDGRRWATLVRRAADGSVGEREVAAALAPALHRDHGRLRRWAAAAWAPRVSPDPPVHACPACGAEVDRSTLYAFPVWAVPTDIELVAACARAHATHDRTGTAPARRAAHPPERWCPAVVGAAEGDGAPLVALTARGPVALRPRSGGSSFDVLVVDELQASDLVGAWTSLWARSRPVGSVPASACRLDDETRIDWAAVTAALDSEELVRA